MSWTRPPLKTLHDRIARCDGRRHSGAHWHCRARGVSSHLALEWQERRWMKPRKEGTNSGTD